VDSREARKILATYRPGDTDSPDPRMAQALQLARKDPQLAVWFGQHCAAHVTLPTELGTAQPPPESKEPKPPGEAGRPEYIIFNKPALVMLAGTALLLLGAWLWPYFATAGTNTLTSYRDRMARLVQRAYPMKIAVTDQAQLREYFRVNGGPVGFPLPKNLEKLPATGGAVFTWHSQPVALLGLDAGGNTNVYVFLIKRSVFETPTPSDKDKAEFEQIGRLNTATWTIGDTVYLLASPADKTTIQNFLE
jgi:hypothetical protein